MKISKKWRATLSKEINVWKKLERKPNAAKYMLKRTFSSPLCKLSRKVDTDSIDLTCKGCPIAEYTGLKWCQGTPIQDMVTNKQLASHMRLWLQKLKRDENPAVYFVPGWDKVHHHES